MVHKEIYEFVKDKKGQKVGLLFGYGRTVSGDDPELIYTITTSRCSPTDEFSEDRAIAIARGRAQTVFHRGYLGDEPALSIINSKQFEKFAIRCKRYFKKANYVGF